jgi:hypothetical protein
MSLSTTQIESISRQVYRQFPEVRDTHPSVQDQAGAKGLWAAAVAIPSPIRGAARALAAKPLIASSASSPTIAAEF